jgi:hypothetical protein
MASVTNESAEEKKTLPPIAHFDGKEACVEFGSVDGFDVLALASDEHPAHPRNWPTRKKWFVLFILCTFQAFMYDSPEMKVYYAV